MKDAQKITILGFGSDSGDDALGWVVARKLTSRLPQCEIRELRSPLDLCDYAGTAEELHVVDACRGAGLPGSIFCYDWQSLGLNDVRFSGTHDINLVAALKLAEQLVGLPQRVTIWSIEASQEMNRHFPSIQCGLSAIVATAAEELVEKIVKVAHHQTSSVQDGAL